MNKIKIENNESFNENIHKIKISLEKITKEKNELQENYNELLKRTELKEKINKVNKSLLNKNKKIKKFSNLSKCKVYSLTIKNRLKKNKIINSSHLMKSNTLKSNNQGLNNNTNSFGYLNKNNIFSQKAKTRKKNSSTNDFKILRENENKKMPGSDKIIKINSKNNNV